MSEGEAAAEVVTGIVESGEDMLDFDVDKWARENLPANVYERVTGQETGGGQPEPQTAANYDPEGDWFKKKRAELFESGKNAVKKEVEDVGVEAKKAVKKEWSKAKKAAVSGLVSGAVAGVEKGVEWIKHIHRGGKHDGGGGGAAPSPPPPAPSTPSMRPPPVSPEATPAPTVPYGRTPSASAPPPPPSETSEDMTPPRPPSEIGSSIHGDSNAGSTYIPPNRMGTRGTQTQSNTYYTPQFASAPGYIGISTGQSIYHYGAARKTYRRPPRRTRSTKGRKRPRKRVSK